MAGVFNKECLGVYGVRQLCGFANKGLLGGLLYGLCGFANRLYGPYVETQEIGARSPCAT